jgi:D-xylose transport system ATP-binding protein
MLGFLSIRNIHGKDTSVVQATKQPDIASGADAQPRPRHGAPAVALGLRLLNVGPVLILVLLIAGIGLLTPNFLKPGNIGNILAQTAVIAIVAIGQHLVILTRGIDLSVGANLALATVVGGLVYRWVDSSALVILAMLASGVLVGFVNGAVYVFGRLPHPFIITLATLSICKGLALELAINHTTMRGMPGAVAALGETSSLGVPNSFFVVVGVALVVLVLTKSMVWGRWTYAVGGNPKAAVEMGIPGQVGAGGHLRDRGPVRRHRRGGARRPDRRRPRRSTAICWSSTPSPPSSSAGRASSAGAAISATRSSGAVMIGVIRNALNLLNVDVFYQMIAIGLIIVLAVEAGRAAQPPRGARPGQPGEGRGMSAPVLSVRGAHKRFGAVHALKGVGLEAWRGEVLALLGDNGAGKSTLVRCISGVHALDEGEILLDGEAAAIGTPALARLAGIETVYQDLALFDNLTPAQNFYCGREISWPTWLPRALRFLGTRAMDREAAAVIDRLKVRLPRFDAPVAVMSGGQRQAIAVARATVFARKVVILDEPTAALGLRESRKVLDLVRQLRDEGNAVILITHNMEQVIELADRAVVLRQGRKVGELKPERANQQELVSLIVGAEG